MNRCSVPLPHFQKKRMCLLVVSGQGSVSHTDTVRARSQKTESEEARHVLSGPFIIKNVYLDDA